MFPRTFFLAPALAALMSAPAAAQPPRTDLPHEGIRISVAFSPDRKHIATGGLDNRIRIWDLATGKQTLSVPAHRAEAGVSRLVFFPDGKTLASAGWAGDGSVKLLDAATGEERRFIGQDKGGICFLAVAATGKVLAWGNAGKIHLYDVTADRETRLLRAPAAVDSVAFSPDSALLASANGGGTVRLWDVATGTTIHDFPAGQSTATGSQAVAFSPDGKTLATASERVRLWDVASGKERPPLGAAGPGVFAVAFSPDGRFLAAATWGDFILWDAASGKEVRRWRERAYSVAFSPDSTRLAFGRADGATVVELK